MDPLKPGFSRRVWLGALFLAVLAVYGNTCSDPPAGPSHAVPTGNWGGTSIQMSVTADGSTVQLDCAHGSFTGAPPSLDATGRFKVNGKYVREGAGPTRVNETPVELPAVYSGTTDGQTMKLTITVTDSQQALGPFDLGLGKAPRLFRCQ